MREFVSGEGRHYFYSTLIVTVSVSIIYTIMRENYYQLDQIYPQEPPPRNPGYSGI